MALSVALLVGGCLLQAPVLLLNVFSSGKVAEVMLDLDGRNLDIDADDPCHKQSKDDQQKVGQRSEGWLLCLLALIVM